MAADPRPKSFRDILRNHSEFIKNPVQWSSRHLDLVGCRFEDVATAPVDAEPTSIDHGNNDSQVPSTKPPNGAEVIAENIPPYNPPKDAEIIATNIFPENKRDRLINILVAKEDAEELATQGHPEGKRDSLMNMLAGKTRPFSRVRRGASFFFQGRPVHRPQYYIFHRLEETLEHKYNGALPPLVGYVHYTSVNFDRRKRLEPRRSARGKRNVAAWDIFHKRLEQLTPGNWTDEPYFMCHLLALAQFQERQFNPSDATIFTSRLLATHIDDREHMLVYEAHITTELLNGLRNPMNPTIPLEWPAIRRKKIPYKPYLTFADRLIAELAVPSSLPSHGLLDLSDNVKGVIENDRKRPREQGDDLSCKVSRISKECAGDS